MHIVHLFVFFHFIIFTLGLCCFCVCIICFCVVFIFINIFYYFSFLVFTEVSKIFSVNIFASLAFIFIIFWRIPIQVFGYETVDIVIGMIRFEVIPEKGLCLLWRVWFFCRNGCCLFDLRDGAVGSPWRLFIFLSIMF